MYTPPLPRPYDSLTAQALRAAWFPVLVFACNLAFVFGFGFDAYADGGPVDIPMHILGGVAVTYFFAKTLRPVEEHLFRSENRGYALYVFFLFTCAATSAAVWEILEFHVDLFWGTASQKGVRDTVLDMALGLLGSTLFLVPYALIALRKRKGMPIPAVQNNSDPEA